MKPRRFVPLAAIAAIAAIATIVMSLVATDWLAYWWMNPAPTGLAAPKLVYHPSPLAEEGPSAPNQEDSIITPLPEVLASTLGVLACSNGVVSKIEQASGVVIHIAFFEWDSADSLSVLEAFKHLPEQCMGSIGMDLVEKLPPKFHSVGPEKLLFDHTVFKDPVGRTVHAFKGTWVSGASTLIGTHFRGGADQWRQIRMKAALHRFNPAYARVAQGAVRGIADPQLAWQAFEQAMLKDLRME